mmetsp:Transcript_30463/g.71367  ORF Transcript_30463/g.71367 Transcript_30463/m.71367 type:complete len:224 (+) Transcript_30463:31-702(+)
MHLCTTGSNKFNAEIKIFWRIVGVLLLPLSSAYLHQFSQFCIWQFSGGHCPAFYGIIGQYSVAKVVVVLELMRSSGLVIPLVERMPYFVPVHINHLVLKELNNLLRDATRATVEIGHNGRELIHLAGRGGLIPKSSGLFVLLGGGQKRGHSKDVSAARIVLVHGGHLNISSPFERIGVGVVIYFVVGHLGESGEAAFDGGAEFLRIEENPTIHGGAAGRRRLS